MPPKYYIGCSGWHYDHWRGLYYPEGLSRPKWLQFYAQQFNTVELNNSFYRLPTEKAFISWHESSPNNFAFAVKVSRFITHIKRLRNLESALENFLSRARLLQQCPALLVLSSPPLILPTSVFMAAQIYMQVVTLTRSYRNGLGKPPTWVRISKPSTSTLTTMPKLSPSKML